MSNIINVILLTAFWALSFVNNSGWAESVKLPTYTTWFVIVVSLYLFMFRRRRDLCKNQQLINVGLVLTIIIIPFIVSDKWDGAGYFQAFMVTYLVSYCKITRWVITRACLIVGLLGIVILGIYINGSVLSGWNDNAIAMTGLFSFLFFSIFLISLKSNKEFICWNIVTVIYLAMLFQTECRSGMIFAVLAVVAIYFQETTKKILNKKYVVRLLLNLPLILAFIIILIGGSDYFEDLNSWSKEEFQKGVFNGRDELWSKALEELSESYYLGTGKFTMNYHNSGIAALCVFGIAGYIFWIKYFSSRLNLLRIFLSDKIVFASIVTFSCIFLQQTFELGLITPMPNYIPYMILGIGMGRAYRVLKFKQATKNEETTVKHNNSSLQYR